MTIMNTELYEALVAAGAPDDKAKAAANVVEEQNKRFDQIDHRFDKVDQRFDTMQKEMEHRFDEADSKLELLETNLKNDIQRVETSLKNDMDKMFYRLLASLGGLILFALTVIAKIAKVF